MFVHGGGWSIGDKRTGAGVKAAHFTAQGWAFASVNYRLVPGATVEQQANDIASAIAFARIHAAENGLDPDRIVVMGHSAGAHLAALVGTDPRYLKAAGVPTAVHYPKPLNLQPAYAAYCCPECCPVSSRLAARVLSLPMGADLSVGDQDRVVEALVAALRADPS